jgi:hypothetical protein
LVGASVTGINISNGGKNYATAPTFIFTPVSGGTGASATPTLTTGTTATFTVAFTKTFTYTWNILDIVIYDLGKLSVVNINATCYTAATPYTFRVIEIQYDSRNRFFSDYGNPITSIAQQTNLCTVGSIGNIIYIMLHCPSHHKQLDKYRYALMIV